MLQGNGKNGHIHLVVDLEQVEFLMTPEYWKHGIDYRGVGSLVYLFNDIKERQNCRSLGQSLHGSTNLHMGYAGDPIGRDV